MKIGMGHFKMGVGTRCSEYSDWTSETLYQFLSCLIHIVQRYRHLNVKRFPENHLDLEVMTSLFQGRGTNLKIFLLF